MIDNLSTMYMTCHAMASLNKANKHKQDTGMGGPGGRHCPAVTLLIRGLDPGLVTVQRHGNGERVNDGQNTL